ncbi:MAG: hypothetical protein CMM25_08220 [Rhodospirillaceae bacterium]|nr:hypothetical protein [Rhodospirillaceae bacterium]|tara:strand:+ start:67 stop:420 length:354 start_codon:yes stop_codon:yes gene_type:complete
MNRKAVFSEAKIGTLHVSNLKVTGKHNLDGLESMTPVIPATVISSSDPIELILERLAKLEEEISTLKTENDGLKHKLQNISLNDLVDVEIEDDTQDGSFLGFFERDKVWVPYPEVGN